MQNNAEEKLQRPKPGEDDADLLRLQEEFQRSGKPSAATVVRVGKKQPEKPSVPSPPAEPPVAPKNAQKINPSSGKVNISLEMIPEEAISVLRGVRERNVGFFEIPDKCPPFVAQNDVPRSELYDDGFPGAVDLSAYIKGNAKVAPGKSIFATAFAAESGNLDIDVEQDFNAPNADDPFAENDRKIAAMGTEEIDDALQEVAASLSPEVIEMLRKRGQKKLNEGGNTVPQYIPARVSKFKQKKTGIVVPEEPPKEVESNIVEDAIKNLEVMDMNDEYTRLATDAVQLDFASKCLKTIRPRQQEHILKLFAMLKSAKTKSDDYLISLAREKIDESRSLYLEEVRVSDNKTVLQFPSHISPLLDGAWTFAPIRRVLDVVHKRGAVTADDIEIVQLSLLWSFLLFSERPSLFYTTIETNDVYVRMGEVFLIGPDMYEDSIISDCLDRLLRLYVLPQAQKGFLKLSLVNPVSGLDNFVAFYEDMMLRFEEHSAGSINYTLHILIGAYLNDSIQDSLLTIRALWDPKRCLLRVATAACPQMNAIIEHVDKKRREQTGIGFIQEHFYEVYTSIILQYALSVTKGLITSERNPAIFALAQAELKAFVAHEEQKPSADGAEDSFKSLIPVAKSGIV